MLSSETTYVDPRKRRTVQLLQSALGALLKEETFHNITVQDIAARAGINRATFYAHFTDKYDLLNASVRELFEEQLKARLSKCKSFTQEHLRLLALTVFEYVGTFMGTCSGGGTQTDEGPVMMISVQTSVYETLLKWLKTVPGRADSLETVALMTSWAIFGSALQWTRTNRHQSPEKLVDAMMPVLLDGIGRYVEVDVAVM